MVIPNRSPLNILEKRERGRIQELPEFCGYPLLYQERVKLRTSNLASTFQGQSKKTLKLKHKKAVLSQR